MAVIPPDPGKVQGLVDAMRVQLEQLEQLAGDHGDVVLVLELHAVRVFLARIESSHGAPKG